MPTTSLTGFIIFCLLREHYFLRLFTAYAVLKLSRSTGFPWRWRDLELAHAPGLPAGVAGVQRSGYDRPGRMVPESRQPLGDFRAFCVAEHWPWHGLSLCQAVEWGWGLSFGIDSGSFGSCFYLAHGLHGLHCGQRRPADGLIADSLPSAPAPQIFYFFFFFGGKRGRGRGGARGGWPLAVLHFVDVIWVLLSFCFTPGRHDHFDERPLRHDRDRQRRHAWSTVAASLAAKAGRVLILRAGRLAPGSQNVSDVDLFQKDRYPPQ